jgi:hypothetical protein
MRGLLQKELKKFGLNPREWAIQQTTINDLFYIQHINDNQFCFVGKLNTKPNGNTWEYIELRGI